GLFTFIGGVMSGTGRTIAQGGIEMIGPDAKWVVTRTLVNVGTAIVTARQLGLSDGGLLHNLPRATFDIRSDLRLTYFNGRFLNEGTLRKSAGTGVTDFGVFLHNASAVEVQTGTLRLSVAGSVSTGIITISAGAALEFYSGNHVLADS